MKDMNFLPADYLEKKAQNRTNAISLVLFVIVMGAIVGAFFWTDNQRSDVRDLRAEVDGQFEEAAKRLEQLDQLRVRKEQMTQKAKVTGALLERVPRSLILSELINRMPATIGLRDLTLDTKEIKKKTRAPKSALEKAKQDMANADKPGTPEMMIEISETEVTMRLVGVAPTDVEVAQFMADLGKSPMFGDLNLEYSQEEKVDRQQVRKFQVLMTLNQGIDLKQFEPTMVKRDLDRNPMSNEVRFGAAGPDTAPPVTQVDLEQGKNR